MVAGYTNAGSNPRDFALARLNPNGSPDNGFDGDGRLSTDFGGSEEVTSLALQADGKIVAAGFTDAGPNPQNIALARYNPNGTPDQGFGNQGEVVTDLGAFDRASDVAVQPNGKIAIAASGGLDTPDVKVLRYTAGGGLDQGFGEQGVAQVDLGGLEGAAAVALQADGKIVGVGTAAPALASPPDILVARFEGDSPSGADASIDLTVRAKRKQRVKRLKIKVGCGSEACEARIGGKAVAKRKRSGRQRRSSAAKRRKKTFRVKPRTLSIPAGERTRARVKLKRNKRSVGKLRRLLKRKAYRRKTKAKLKVTASDAAGNSATKRVKVKLRR